MINTSNLPDGRRGQIIAVGLLMVLFALGWAAILQPLMGYYDDRAAMLEDDKDQGDHLALLAGQLPGLRAELASRAPGSATAEATIDGDSDALAGAKLQQVIEQIASAAGMSLSSFEPVPAKPVGPTRRIGLAVSATCTYEQLVHLVVGIEQGSPKMLIDNLQIHNADAGGMDKTHPIEISFTVYAFRKGEAGS